MGKLYLKFSLILFLGIALASCDSSIVDQSAPSDLSNDIPDQQLNASESEPFEDEYLILFKGNKLPKGFKSEVESLGGNVIFQHDIGFAYIGGISEEASIQLQTSEKITQMTANMSYSLGDPVENYLTEEASILSPDNPSSAFGYARQWNMRAIEADKAWENGKLGSEDITIAIIDTGIDYEYPDLNGLVDLTRSISFVEIDDQFAAAFFPGKNPVTDLHYHGTHVAATAVSKALVTAGVSSKATLTAIKACTFTDFSCSFGAVISGVLYAADSGADIINMSLGGGFPKSDFGPFVGFINSTFNYARKAGSMVVVSAGNEATDLDKNGNIYASYCDAPNVICVSATGPTASESVNGPWTNVDAPASYTNFGRSSIDVAAPGGNIGASVWAGCSQTSLVATICQTGVFILPLRGTSMAAPHVSGLAGLIAAEGVSSPGQIKARILQSADDLGQNGTDKFYGKGRINVANALGL